MSKTKTPLDGRMSPPPLDESKSLSLGRLECQTNLNSIKNSISLMLRKRRGPKYKDLHLVQTCSDNIWFLESILNPPKKGAESLVSDSDYRYHFICNVPQKQRCDKAAMDAIQLISKNFEKKKVAPTIDLFLNLMIATGLELYVSSQTELIKYLLFVSQLPPMTTELQAKVVVTKTLKCPLVVLSLLYLNCHFLLLAFGYGRLPKSGTYQMLRKIKAVVQKALFYICGCFPEITQTEQTKEKNVEILLELIWVLLMAQRYVEDEELPENFPVNLENEATSTLLNFNTFKLKGKELKEAEKLRLAFHECQLWLLCDMELSKRPN